MSSSRTVLTLVRHGQTSANIEGVWHGSTNTPLTDHGHLQAAAVGAFLEARHPAIRNVYASPLDRAHHTGLAIASPLGLTPQIEADLVGREPGA